jgi:hypothetical protein
MKGTNVVNKILLVALLTPSLALAELPTPSLQMDKTLKEHSVAADETARNLINSADLPKPNLIMERDLVYTPSTRIRTRIYSNAKYQGMRSIPEREYWRGN